MSRHPLPPLRSDLSALPRYVPGVPPRARDGRPAYKVSSNEVAQPVGTAVMEAAATALASSNRYPDIDAAILVDRLAALHGLDRERVVVGGGSIAVLQQLVQAVTNPRNAVVFAWRSYEAYPIVTRVCRATPVAVPLVEGRHDLVAMAARIVDVGAALAIVCNPNNPTGTAITRSELESFLDTVPSTCVVVLDEAYREFVTDPDVPDGLDLASGRPNVVVLRTFSKAHGLAGLRVGYAVCSPAVADAVRAVALPFTVSSVAQGAAVAALDGWPQRRLVVADIARRREVFSSALRDQGFEVAPSQANFVWLPMTARTRRLITVLGEEGVSVRVFGHEGMRVTIGEPEALDRIMHVTSTIL